VRLLPCHHCHCFDEHHHQNHRLSHNDGHVAPTQHAKFKGKETLIYLLAQTTQWRCTFSCLIKHLLTTSTHHLAPTCQQHIAKYLSKIAHFSISIYIFSATITTSSGFSDMVKPGKWGNHMVQNFSHFVAHQEYDRWTDIVAEVHRRGQMCKISKRHNTHNHTTALWPLYRSACFSWHHRCSVILLPTCSCW